MGSSSLFEGSLIPEEAEHRNREALRFVAEADVDELLTRDLESLVDEYTILFGEATVLWDEVSVAEPVPVPSRPGTPDRVQIDFTVPIEGDGLLLTYKSSQGSPLGSSIRVRVNRKSLQFSWLHQVNAPGESLREVVARVQVLVETFLINNNSDVAPWNQHMRNSVRAAIEKRTRSELERRRLTASLPFPLTRKPGASVPVRVQRTRLNTTPRPAAATPFAPEPELEREAFEAVLQDLISMSTMFERMPLPSGSGEENIRNVLLGMLNTNFAGSVGGEMFNGAGKTDILVREQDRNVFIGECKFYDGPKTVSDAVDQLLSYAVWRDTKAALLVFVRGGNFSEVVAKSVEAVAAHSQCQKQHAAADPARRSDYTFARADDPNRAIHVALLPFRILT